MIKAGFQDKQLIVNILVKSFDENKSVNYIVKQDNKRKQRLRKLMEYLFDVCFMLGDVFLSDNKKACALIVKSDLKKTSFKSVLLNLKLVLSVTGLLNLKKVIKRESAINTLHPKNEAYHYLWFIGVDQQDQNKGIGSKLLNDIITESAALNIPIYLETSVAKNVTWYEKFGFVLYKKLYFGYELFCMTNSSVN